MAWLINDLPDGGNHKFPYTLKIHIITKDAIGNKLKLITWMTLYFVL